MTDIENDENLEINFRKIFSIFLFFTIISIFVFNFKNQLMGISPYYYRWLFTINELINQYGITNVWTPYPQGIQLVSYGIYVISYLFSLILYKIFFGINTFTHLSLFTALFRILLIYIPHVLTFILIYLIGKEFHEKIGLFACIAYALFWTPFYNTVISNDVYDIFPVFLLVASIYLLIKNHTNLSAVFLALGAAVKLFPIVVFFVAFKYIRSENNKIKFGILFFAILLMIYMPFAISNIDIFMSPYHWQSGRPVWQSWYAILAYVMDIPFDYSQQYYWGDSLKSNWIWMGITPKSELMIITIPKQPSQWWNSLSSIGLIISFVPILFAKIQTPKELIDWSLYALTAFMFWNIGWSPQYVLFLLPFIIFLYIDRLQDGIYLAFFLQLIVALAWPVLLPLAMKGDLLFIVWYSIAVIVRYAIFLFIMAVILKRYVNHLSLRNIWT